MLIFSAFLMWQHVFLELKMEKQLSETSQNVPKVIKHGYKNFTRKNKVAPATCSVARKRFFQRERALCPTL